MRMCVCVQFNVNAGVCMHVCGCVGVEAERPISDIFVLCSPIVQFEHHLKQ